MLDELFAEVGWPQASARAALPKLDGWQEESGRLASHVPYWDAVAALNTPTDPTGFWSAFDPLGEPLTGAEATERRDAFLRMALDDLAE